MSQVAIIGGLVLALCSSSCLSSMLMTMGGGVDEAPAKKPATQPSGSGAATSSPSPSPPPPPPPPPSGLGDVMFVRVERPAANYPNNIINLAEMEIYDMNGTNIARNKRVYGAFGSHDAGPYERLVDGDKTNFAHTGGVNGTSVIEVDLGSIQTIKEVVIYNRSGAADRTRNMVLKFLRFNGDILYTSPPVEPNRDKMTFNISTRQWTY